VLYLDKDFRLISDTLHSSGTIDWAAVYPREIIKRALNLNAYSVVMMHNHPTPNTSFSTPDIEITREVKKMLESIGVNFFDHLLVSGSVVYSVQNMQLLK
jgi:DNA repair protein RadC